MSSIAVYFTKPGFDDYPFDEAEYREAYALLGTLLQERGATFSIVRGHSTYQGGTTFKGGWKFTDGAWKRIHGKHPYDLIFNKGRVAFDAGARVLNDPRLDALCIDKWETYKRFAALSPRTYLVQNRNELEAAVRSIGEATVVAKPTDEEGGKGVIIGPAEKILTDVMFYPYLVQELIDTSRGIPGIIPGRHDLRMIVVQGEIVSAFVRSPADGKFVANVSQGGSIKNVPVATLPESARDIAAKIDKEFSRFESRMYSVDLGMDEGKDWKIIELNSQPGLSIEDYKDSDEGKLLFTRVADLLAAAARNGK